MMRKYHLAAALLVGLVLVTACVSTSQGSATHSESRDQVSRPVSERTFLQIFQDAETTGKKTDDASYDLSEPARAYINRCCEDETRVVELLEDNGFTIFPNRIDSDKPDIQQAYDERIVAERDAERFLYVWKTYRVAVYLNDSKVVGVKAYAFQNGI